MKRPNKTLVWLAKMLSWSAAGCYFVVTGYQGLRNPSPDSSRFALYFQLLFAGLMFHSAFDTYRKRNREQPAAEPDAAAERLTRTDRIVFRLMGALVILVGLAGLGMGGWLAHSQWARVARWPRTDALLISKDISKAGARLVFQYEAAGRQSTGVGFRWGSEKTVRAALESYQPGTVQKISYDPENPGSVETILSYSWELFFAPISATVISVLLIAGGVVVYRWSYR
jgi:hypothetical protein